MQGNHHRILAALWLLASITPGSTANAQTRLPDTNVVMASQASLIEPVGPSVQLEDLATQVQRQAIEIDRLREQFAASQEAMLKSATVDPLSFRGKWDYGLWFESANGDFRANIGGRVEQDWVWFDTEPDLAAAIGHMDDGVFFRRARIHGAGRMYGVIDLFAEFEAAPVDNLVFQDMWAQLREIPLIGHLRVGHVKVPLGLENYTSAKYITFFERSAVHDAFQQEYDPGMVAWNYGPEKNVTWAAALMRLDPDESGRAFGNGRYSGVGRVTMVPWSANDDRALLHLGGGYRYDHGGIFDPAVGTEVVRFRTRPEFRNTRRFLDTGPLISSGTSILVVEGAVVLGSFSVQAEYLSTTVHDASIPMGGPALGNASFDGYYVYASYLLTGETRPYDRTTGAFGRVVPAENVRPGTGNMLLQGAWEVGIRYSLVDLNDPGVNGGVLQTVTTGLTWYLNPNTKVLFNYIWARRDVPGPPVDGDANLFGTRFHIAF